MGRFYAVPPVMNHRLTDLQRDVFNKLCVAVLKRNISRRVTQTSRGGSDGKRDAVLFGQGTGEWATYPWRSWVFQFKQYGDDTKATRDRALSDFKSEAAAVLTVDSKWDVFFFLTSVSFTGVPVVGLYDRVGKATAELRSRFHRDVVFWDAIELHNLIAPNAPDYAPFFEPVPWTRRTSIAVGRDTSWSQLAVVEVVAERLLEESQISQLLPDVEPVLGPGSQSSLWILANAGRWGAVRSITRRALAVLRGRRRVDSRLDCWLTVIGAWAAAQQGAIRPAALHLKALKERRVIDHDRELAAWVANVEALCFGKSGDEAKAQALADRAVRLAEESGSYWLAHTVAMRQLHRMSWHAWEKGTPMTDDDFDGRSETARTFISYADAKGGDSMRISHDVVALLHRSWRRSYASQAQMAIGQLLVNPLLPTDEQARLTSEYGRVSLYAAEDDESAIEWLKQAVVIRAATGHRPRLRYDLAWLADAYLLNGNHHFARACAVAAKRLHQRLYGRLPTDVALVAQFRLTITKTSAVSVSHLGELLEYATGVSETWWGMQIDTKTEEV